MSQELHNLRTEQAPLCTRKTSRPADVIRKRKQPGELGDLLESGARAECSDNVLTVEDFHPPRWAVHKRGRGNPGTRSKRRYSDIVCAFDIETTRIKEIEQATMYIWQAQVGIGCTVVGRTWEEFGLFCEKIRAVTPEGRYVVFYVHNLSYEFQFLRGVYNFSPDEVFCIDKRRILKCEMYGCIELRCSYLHSNMSLKMYTDKMNVVHKKLDGEEFDYDARRWFYTELTAQQLLYCINDVRGLVEAVITEMQHDGDNLYTIPPTSTGYVRRDTKRAMHETARGVVADTLPTYEVYKMLREAFRGGDTHANRHFSGQIIEDVNSWDRSSSYPDVLCNCEYPMTEFLPEEATTGRVINLIGLRGKALLLRAAFRGIRLKSEDVGCPYIPADKCRNMRMFFRKDEERTTFIDNGRVMKSDYLEITLTDIDLRIILEQYDFEDMTPIDVYSASYGRLPQQLIDVNIEYYRRKTELKDVEGQELLYFKSKNKLNSIYGMMAQSPVKQSIDFINEEFVERNDDEEELLEKSNKKAFLSYAWGCWCTAHARRRLQEGIKIAGEGFIYCDTDSVKFIGDHTAEFEKYNEQRKRDSLKSGAYATDPHGVTHYMGVYEQEKHCMQFATLGAKKYCYVTDDGELHATIAGVSKKDGGPELERAGGISAFREGFVFHDAGGTEAVYNDAPPMSEYVNEDGVKIPITANVVIRPSTYTLGLSAEYARLLDYYLDYDW